MVDHMLPFFIPFKRYIQSMYWPAIDYIRKVEVPMLVICGRHDEVIPKDHSKRLFDTATRCISKQLFVVPGGRHNDTWLRGGKEYSMALRDFMDKARMLKTNPALYERTINDNGLGLVLNNSFMSEDPD